MNILASYNWIKEYLDTDLSAEEFAKKTTDAGNSVDRMERVGDRFEKMVIGLVKSIHAHPNADKLKIAKTDIGNEVVEIVCGGENLAEGQRVVVGLPGARVKWHGQGDLIELTKTKIRGQESHGMICAVEEIGFEKIPAGEKDIWDLTQITDAKPGTPLAQALGLNDIIFDIEVTSNRPDCKSIIGQAREGGAVTMGASKIPNKQIPNSKKIPNSKFEIQNKEPELCPKYSAVLIENVKVGSSPWWMQKKLLLAGFKPINNIVDVTNYVLHEYGQPLHTFDANKLHGEKIVIRKAKKNEKFLALDGKEYELGGDMLVIADAKRAVAVAGVMGGEETGTTESTTSVLIEAATFDPVSVRHTARALNLYSDSQLLFEKGLSTQATDAALARAVELIQQIAGGEMGEVMISEAKPYEPRVLPFDPEKANALMGIEMKEKEMMDILERLGFELAPLPTSPLAGGGGRVTVPYWRDHDIENSVDFVEEIARVYGYGNFPVRLPEGQLSTLRQDSRITWELKLKQIFTGAGLTEAYSYAYVSEDQLKQYGLDVAQAVKLRNPLTVEQEYLRTSLIPSMLTTIAENQTRFSEADLFELAPVYHLQKNDIPDQPSRLVLAFYGKDGAKLFARAKGLVERLCRETGIRSCEWLRPEKEDINFHAGRTAKVQANGSVCIGMVGQVSAQSARAFGIDVDLVLGSFDFDAMLPLFTNAKVFSALPQFPIVKRDLAMILAERTEFQSIASSVKKSSTLLDTCEMFDVFHGGDLEPGKKSIAIHLSFRTNDRTLEAKEVDLELDKIRDVLQKEFGAMMRS